MNSYNLRDLLEIKNGRDHKNLPDGDIPVFGSGGLMRFVDKAIYNDESILLPRKGSLENIQFTREPFWTVDTLYYTIVNKEKANAYYLYNYLRRLDLSNLNSGTGVPSMTFGAYYDVQVNLPDLLTQQQNAAVLSALDDKIELNNCINAELEQIAKTLYDYWFVQFDFPDVDGKPYKSSGGKMVYNEVLKREIPEGWEVKSLYKTAEFINGLACQKYRPENDTDNYLPVIKIREMGGGVSENTEKVRSEIPEKYKINDGDVLFSWSATLDVKIWVGGKGALNQHIFKVVSKEFPRSFYYFEILNYLHHFKMMAELRKTTMGHITIDHLKTSFISIPSNGLIESLDQKLDPIFSKIITNKKQNQELSQLRDWLLPMLMNGQVKVKDIIEKEEELGMAAEDTVEYLRKNISLKNKIESSDKRYDNWISKQGLVARGEIDSSTMREIFDAMDDEDK